ncbi:MAG: hypothetical protein HY809_02330 [Nitrospirae bacterium]|nr:hypothetical protein [Nitrospirota bacterium]
MIEIIIKERALSYRVKLFHESPAITDCVRFAQYIAAKNIARKFGFKRETVFTKLIDLTASSEEILSQCGKNNKYKIKRAEKEGIRFEIENDPHAFTNYYRLFAKSKSSVKEILEMGIDYIDLYKGYITITKAAAGNEVLAMHSYVADREGGRVRLLHAASLFRDEDDSQKRSLIGRANRFLHFQDMLYFKDNGFRIYDMGGYAYNSDNPELQKINEFKDSFGGKLIEESIYVSLPLYLLKKAAEKASGRRRKQGQAPNQCLQRSE